MLERCGICSSRQRTSNSRIQTDVPGLSLTLISRSIHSETELMCEPHISQDPDRFDPSPNANSRNNC